jgi:hypothetical protein
MTDRFPVEPLSEKRWQQIKKNVLEQAAALDAAAMVEPEPPQRAPRAAWIGAGAVLAAAAAAIVFLLRPPGDAAPVARAPEPSATAATSHVVTNDDSATMTAGDVTVEVAARSSVMALERAPDAWTVSLESGSAHFAVPPRDGRPSFVVEAGRTRVEVIGTAFTVTRAPGAASASVTVEHGVVRVTDADALVVLHDGEQWPGNDGVVGASASGSDAERASEDEGERASDEEAVASARASVRESTRDGIDRAAVLAPPPVVPSQRDRYRAAEAAEATDPDRALAEYAALAREGGAWGAPALMSEARLAAELHHDADARALAQRYLDEHPDGINAEDARELLRRLR